MGIPLVRDLRAQRQAVAGLLWKGALLLSLFVGLDRVLGGMLRQGLERYYGLDEPAVILCVGHSHTVLGIDKVALEQALGVKVAKFAVEGANTLDRAMMLRYYFKRHPESVRAVIYDVDAHAFTSAGLSSSSYRLLFPFIADPAIGAYIRQNCSSRTEYWLRRVLCTPRYNELTLSLAVRGYLRKWTNFKSGRVDVAVLRQQVQQGRFRRIAFDRDNIQQFEEMARFVTSQHAKLLLAYIPTIDIFNQAEPEKYQQSISLFTRFASANANIVFLNYNVLFEARHELFRDPIHLNRAGQQEVTAQIAADLKRLMGPERIPTLSAQNIPNPK